MLQIPTMRFMQNVTLAAGLLFTASVASANGRNPGSLLVFPEFDHTTGHNTLITVTNTNETSSVRIRFKYVSGYYDSGTAPFDYRCEEEPKLATLTAGDTLTVLTCAHNTNSHVRRGFLYVYAVTTNNPEKPISFNSLVGDSLQLDGSKAFRYSVVPLPFRSPVAAGANTDLENAGVGDGVRDLDGLEYEMAPEIVLVPRFIAQDSNYSSELVLLSMTGGSKFTSMAYFLIYNDNEEVFSQEYQIKCWDRRPLTDYSPAFGYEFLHDFTQHAANEIVGWPLDANQRRRKAGWFSVDGVVASSPTTSIPDPVMLCVLLERDGAPGVANNQVGGELPFLHGTQANGDLLPSTNAGE